VQLLALDFCRANFSTNHQTSHFRVQQTFHSNLFHGNVVVNTLRNEAENLNQSRLGNLMRFYFIMDNGQWFIVSYDSDNKQEHYKRPLH